MMSFREFEMVEGLPSGMCACRINETDVQLAGISPESLTVRTPEEIPNPREIRLYFYRPQAGNYESHLLQAYQTGQAQRKNGAVLTRFFFDDPACAAKIRRMLNDYARFLEIRSAEGASAYAAAVFGYPEAQDDVFPESLQAARRAWFESLPALMPIPDATELAVELNCAELWNLYLETPVDRFMQAYAAARALPRGWLPERAPDRLYIGNPFCRHVFPGEEILRAMLHKARTESLAVSLVAAEMRLGDEQHADFLAALAAEFGAELVINDWGMLQRMQKLPDKPEIALGTQLNRRRKDPRMAYKSGFEGHEVLLKRNSLNHGPWLEFLKGMGVCRLEYESCSQPLDLPRFACSLHLPFYQTNTSLWCPLKAICEEGNRGMQRGSQACPGWCERNAMLYPEHLHMLGRWNPLLALDMHCSESACMPGFDRWVLNF